MQFQEKETLLVVDDDAIIRELLVSMLSGAYRVLVARDGEQALQAARRGGIDLILLDLVMPVLGGFEVCRALKDDPGTAAIPVVFLTAERDSKGEALGFRFGAADYITKPFTAETVRARIRNQLALSNQQRQLEVMVQKRTRKLEQAGVEMLRQLGRAAGLRDGHTGEHVAMVGAYAYHIARQAGLSERQAELIRTAAPLHDLGKIGVPEYILLKPGPLDPDEWSVVHTHCEVGYRIIGEHESELLRTAALCAYCHHERWDGAGYPRGLSGESIPLAARILAVADVFDALTSERPYKKAWTVEAAVAEMVGCAGAQFDPFVVDAFLSALPEIMLEMTVMTPAVDAFSAKPALHGRTHVY